MATFAPRAQVVHGALVAEPLAERRPVVELGDVVPVEDWYADANRILGRPTKVTPSSKVVGDLALQLAAANAELDAFAYSVSHDLRGTLRRLQGLTKVLRVQTSQRGPHGHALLVGEVCSRDPGPVATESPGGDSRA